MLKKYDIWDFTQTSNDTKADTSWIITGKFPLDVSQSAVIRPGGFYIGGPYTFIMLPKWLCQITINNVVYYVKGTLDELFSD